MSTAALVARIRGVGGERHAIAGASAVTYGELTQRIDNMLDQLDALDVQPGAVCSLAVEYRADTVALFLALMTRHVVAVLPPAEPRELCEDATLLAQVERHLQLGEDGRVRARDTGVSADHPLLQELRARSSAGIVLFTSGTSGVPKAIVHDFGRLSTKYLHERPGPRMIGFLAFDHMGGLNSLLHTLANGGCLVVPADRRPATVAAAIARWRAEVLPVSPTFLSLLLLSGAADDHDLSSLRMITYGTEPMPEATLRACRMRFPEVELRQTYGLSEIGVLRSRSRSAESLWMQVGGREFETRIVNGELQLSGGSLMLGYLNAPSPFTPDGWLATGDAVEEDGPWIRVLGRRSELISVGGEKVHPSEVEGVIERMPGVRQVLVRAEPHALVGNVLVADVALTTGEDARAFRRRMRLHCRGRLARWKLPVRVELVEERPATPKKQRRRA